MTDEKPRGSQPHDETQPVRPEGAPVDQPAARSAATPPAAPAAETPAEAPAPAAAAYAVPAAPVAEPAAKRGFRERFRRARGADGDRAFSLGALIASALAGIIVGGLGVTAVHAVGHDGPDRGNWSQQRGPMGGTFNGPGGDEDGGRGPSFGHGGGMPGQVQPTTPPEDESDSGTSS